MAELDEILRHEIEERRRTMIYALALILVIILTVAVIIAAYA